MLEQFHEAVELNKLIGRGRRGRGGGEACVEADCKVSVELGVVGGGSGD